MRILRASASFVKDCSTGARPLVLVPTMGGLHAGHAALINRARRLAGAKGRVAVSLFVNPIQFGANEDLSRYPRTWAEDVALCRNHGADLLFAPGERGMYAPDHSVYVEETELSKYWCGVSRPGHFRGVCTVVAKLFLLSRAEIAVFGEKDFQQLCIIRRMTRDLGFPVRIVGSPTVREKDGLALSSRNQYLDPVQRREAVALWEGLQTARRLFKDGETSAARLRQAACRRVGKAPGARIDYLDIVNPSTLQPVQRAEKKSRMLMAVYFGSARLIDNLSLG